MELICPRCQNQDPDLFHHGSKGVYCRACVQFPRLIDATSPFEENVLASSYSGDYVLDFELTPLQKKISKQICEKMKSGDVLIWAVTGAGKTELCMEFIQQCLKERKRVAVVIARRQVVLELKERFSKAFSCKVIAVCEGYTSDLQGDLIICTAHQCYRYFESKFDHIIVDEPDAFPYYGNSVLQGIVRSSCRGSMLYLTATPDEQLLKSCQVLKLFCRPHGYPLPVPAVKQMFVLPSVLFLLKWCHIRVLKKIPFLVFVPTIQLANHLYDAFRVRLNVEVCTSKTEQKDQVIQRFKEHQIQGLICTTVLERGVTFAGVDVVVWHADHSVFTTASLIQIAGRVGRKPSFPKGDCLFLSFSKSETVDRCVRMIEEANREKVSSLQQDSA